MILEGVCFIRKYGSITDHELLRSRAKGGLVRICGVCVEEGWRERERWRDGERVMEGWRERKCFER